MDNQKKLANSHDVSFAQRQKSFDALAGLAENGEESVINEFSEIIKNRSKQKDVPESKWGLDPVQESAFYTLIRLDNPESNDALFGLLDSGNVNTTVKYAILKKLSSEKRGFLNEDNRAILKNWLYSRPVKELDWQDLRFIKAILNNIPSNELREKSQQYIGYSFGKMNKA